MQLSTKGVNHIERIAGRTPGVVQATRLVVKYLWSDRTMKNRNQIWEAWLRLCAEEGRLALPVTGAHLFAKIGWLMLKRERGGPEVGIVSVQQNLSAVRHTQLTKTGVTVPSF